MIFERLTAGQPLVQALESQLEDFAVFGLRTLCLAERVLTQAEYEEWNVRYVAGH